MKKQALLLVGLLFLVSTSFGQSLEQSVVSIGGAYLSNGDYSLAYTLGEVMITTYYTEEQILTQGFHQGFNVKMDPPVIPTSNFYGKVYPNPVFNTLNIELVTEEDVEYKLALHDMSGRLLPVHSEQFKGKGHSKFTMDLSNLSAGIYFVRVSTKENPNVQTFKINHLTY